MTKIELTELERRKMSEAGRQSIDSTAAQNNETTALGGQAKFFDIVTYTGTGATCTHGWRPIETAPRDGTKVLLWNNGGMDIYWWHENKYEDMPNWINETGWVPVTPTHWQPLPKPPQENIS